MCSNVCPGKRTQATLPSIRMNFAECGAEGQLSTVKSKEYLSVIMNFVFSSFDSMIRIVLD